MKFLFKIIVVPILAIVAVPLIMAAILYKSVDIPVDDFTSSGNTVLLADMVNDEVDAFLESNDNESSIGLSISQKEANLMLKEVFVTQNPKYMDANATADEKNYVMKESMYGYQGSWVRFKEDIVEIESGAHIFMGGFTFKTRLLITFKLEADTEEIILTLDKLTIGNLPLAWAFGAADWAVSKITGDDLEAMINSQLNGMATFDPAKREIKVKVQDLIDATFSDDPQQAGLINSLMAFVDENELLAIGFADGTFDADLALGKTRDDSPVFELLPSQRIVDEAGLNSIFESKATSIVLSALTTTTDPYIEFGPLTLNRILDYMLKDQQQSPGILQESVIFENYQMKAYVPYVTMVDNVFIVNIPLKIVSIAQPTHKFETIIKIDAVPTIEGSDLVIVLNELVAGQVTLANEHVANILTMLGDTDLIVDGNLVIKNFDQQMSQAGMSIKSVGMVKNKLRIYVGLNDSINLGDLQDTIGDVLDALNSNPTLPPGVNDALGDIMDNINDPNGDPEQAAEDFMLLFDGLDDAEQQEVYDALLAELEGGPYSLDDILGITP